MKTINTIYQVRGEEIVKIPMVKSGESVNIRMGTCTTLPYGSSPVANCYKDASGTWVLNLSIPRSQDGPDGIEGTKPTISMGTCTMGSAVSASLTSSGNNTYVLNLVLEEGEKGEAGDNVGFTVGSINKGNASGSFVSSGPNTFNINMTVPQGLQGSAGADGVTPVISSLNVTTLNANAEATAYFTSNNNNYTLNVGIPRGSSGADGDDVTIPTLSKGTITTLAAGSTPTLGVVSNTNGSYTLNLGIPKGATGATGSNGQSATVTINSTVNVTTLDPGSAITSSWTSTVSGRNTEFTLSLGLPRGSSGASGSAGAAGKNETFTIGTVTTLDYGNNPTLEIVPNPSAPNYKLNIGLPRGSTGSQGDPGANGVTPTLTMGTVTTLAAGSTPTASWTKNDNTYALNLNIPRGSQGASGASGAAGTNATLSLGTVTTLNPGSPTLTITSNGAAYTMALGIPRGASGAGGTSGTSCTVTPTMTSGGLSVTTGNAALSITSSGSNAALTVTLPKGATGGSTNGTTYYWKMSYQATTGVTSSTTAWSGSTCTHTLYLNNTGLAGAAGHNASYASTFAQLSTFGQNAVATSFYRNWLTSCLQSAPASTLFYTAAGKFQRDAMEFSASSNGFSLPAGTYFFAMCGGGGGGGVIDGALSRSGWVESGPGGHPAGTTIGYITLTATSTCSVTIGAGGAPGVGYGEGQTGQPAAKSGGTTTFKVGTTSYTALGGSGGNESNEPGAELPAHYNYSTNVTKCYAGERDYSENVLSYFTQDVCSTVCNIQRPCPGGKDAFYFGGGVRDARNVAGAGGAVYSYKAYYTASSNATAISSYSGGAGKLLIFRVSPH